jgi:hypothetical protein
LRYAHLGKGTADRPSPPFLATKVDELISKLFIRVFGQTIVDTWKLFTEKALLATMVTESASSGLVFRRILLSET